MAAPEPGRWSQAKCILKMLGLGQKLFVHPAATPSHRDSHAVESSGPWRCLDRAGSSHPSALRGRRQRGVAVGPWQHTPGNPPPPQQLQQAACSQRNSDGGHRVCTS
uniref:Uncharacterized protein n=1 Tax=Eutreptiella gymnastica TaxID=73025 RepID=A0A6T1XL09_9EUGL|mmetsp:Transcript_30133/g.50963  ORF Transcript_30133/g.50963 Transcript_30133/m.50963 type:complete len:107 (+) Transcript_30133:206-526(+)